MTNEVQAMAGTDGPSDRLATGQSDRREPSGHGLDLHALLANAQPTRWARVVPPPRLSRRALARAGVMWSPEVQRRAETRDWLTPRARRRLSADLTAFADLAEAGGASPRYTPKPTRAQRRAIGAGPWPKLRRRAEAARRARVG